MNSMIIELPTSHRYMVYMSIQLYERKTASQTTTPSKNDEPRCTRPRIDTRPLFTGYPKGTRAVAITERIIIVGSFNATQGTLKERVIQLRSIGFPFTRGSVSERLLEPGRIQLPISPNSWANWKLNYSRENKVVDTRSANVLIFFFSHLTTQHTKDVVFSLLKKKEEKIS